MAQKRVSREPPDATPAEEIEAAGNERPADEQRRGRIAEAAYYNAERRGFQPGGEEADWLEAERQVDGRGSEKGVKAEASLRQDAGARGSESPVASDRPDFPDLNEAGIEHIEPDQVAKWARRLKVPAPRLREAIQRVGPVVSDIRQFLRDESRS